MSIKVMQLLKDYTSETNISQQEYTEMYSGTNFIITPEQSKKLRTYNYPIIIISASGMVTGGRILHHIKDFGTKHNNVILFTGYQAVGTRGRDILDGKKEIKIHGEMVQIRARVEKLNNLSAHADYEEILHWLSGIQKKPIKVFITHGEEEGAESMKKKIEERFGWNCEVPEYLQTEEL
jgi:metallo-beta-lactamase family protein